MSIIGSVLGSGLFGGGKGKTVLQTIGGILGFGGNSNPNQIKKIVQDARKAGIHPLAALGSPVSASYQGPVGSTFTGDAVGDGMAMQGLTRDLLKAQITTEKARAEALIAEARSRTGIAQNRASETGGPKPIPLWVKAVDRDGNEMWVPNPDGPDPEQFLVPGLSHGADVVVGDPKPRGPGTRRRRSTRRGSRTTTPPTTVPPQGSRGRNSRY